MALHAVLPEALLPVTSRTRPQIIASLRDLAGEFDVVLCDVWGVLHNGLQAYAEASDALRRVRARGGTVVLVSNAPRPHSVVEAHLKQLGVDREAWDEFVTSGDLTREVVASRPGIPLHHIGPSRDFRLFDGLDAPRVGEAEAQYLLCTGPMPEDVRSAEYFRDAFSAAVGRGLEFVCANPDLVVEKGEELLLCAGSLALLYESLGGQVLFAGKPHRPIYELALSKAARRRGGPVDARRVLAIGDAPRTDIAGAQAIGARSLLVAKGIHAKELMPQGVVDSSAVERMFAEAAARPDAVIDQLRW
ncbi:HAD-superfamily class IIA hydrolase, TIGR01459 [Rhizobiales bacterium GAS191]|jgi:HAD superfamily hydrolase (TIGR01459 family)|nr:HAD-superfamily class IIA hydrolase, TIGR01459 [Rhizobiales bacterium GAS113]SEE05604.1 HAD-superfamily class IIA hydrolase, TIGR01459 [Rhizobiales bacterium GAS188]SEE49556.1 HAD-superfamily class IIA hydrolase, TIGR01459 [Rhizobiales bacterium GAS191]